MSKKVYNVQALRGIAILAVLLPHLKVYETRFGHGLLGASPLFQVGNAGVDLFFCISGFVMITVAAGRFRGAAGIGDFLYRRVTRIYPLYWFYTLLVLPLFLRHPEMVNASQGGMHISLWKAFLLFPQQADPLVAQGWTLVHEMYFYIAFVLLLQMPAEMLIAGLLAWAGAVTVAAMTIHAPSPWVALICNPLTLEFILGCFVALAVRRGISRLGPLFIACGTIGFIVAGGAHVIPTSAWSRVLWYGVPSALLLYGAAASEARGVLRMPGALCYVGDISYSMYLSHGLVLAALGRIWWRFLPAGIVSNLAGCLTLAAIALVCATLSYRLIERPLLSIFRRNPFAPRTEPTGPQTQQVVLSAS